MSPIRIGFIGLSTQGWASTALVGPLFDPLLSSSYTLTALCTRSEASATKASKKYTQLAGRTVKAYYGDEGLHAIAKDPEVDLVAVSVKAPEHYKAVMPAIEAGKDIFIEWPVGKNYAETVEIAEAAKRKGVRVLVGAQGIQNSSLQKVKELVDSGKIGRILSTTAILASPIEFAVWTNIVASNYAYALDINNGVTPLSVPIGHFLSALTNTLGDFAEVSANGAIQYPTSSVIDEAGKPTGETIKNTVFNQVSLTGTLQPKGNDPGAFVNLHFRAALPVTGEHGRGRTPLKWIIDGELGTIEMQNDPALGLMGSFISSGRKRILLNGEEVTWEDSEAERLDSTGKAWLEFSKGEKGKYWGLDESVKLHRALDAALTSINEGRKIVL